MEWWVRMVSPVRRVWIRLATRIRIRKSGLRQLRREVSTCEYEDVHVMWEMLRKTEKKEMKRRGSGSRSRRRRTWASGGAIGWAPLNLCRTF